MSGNIPIVYARYKDPKPLSPLEVGYLLSQARAAQPAGRSIWFVLVLWHQDDDYMAEVYFSPDEQTPRLRKGRYLYLWDPAQRKTHEDLGTTLDAGKSQKTRYRHYLQVSAACEPFTTSLTAPAIPLLPFDKPDGIISDADVVAVVDLVRSGPHPAPVKREDGHTIFRAAFDPKLPIHRIARGPDAPYMHLPDAETDGKDLVIVQTGWQVNMIAGYGQILYCKRTGHGFELLDHIGEWVS